MYAVIMAGGGGTRLHPLSRPERPKPFLPLLGDESLLQATAAAPAPADRRHHGRHRPALRAARPRPAPGAPRSSLEPMGRNTAAAIALATTALDRPAEDEVMLVVPADAHIDPAREGVYRDVLRKAAEHLATGAFDIEDPLVTLGTQVDRSGDRVRLPASRTSRPRQDIDGLDGLPAAGASRRSRPPSGPRSWSRSPGVAWNAGIFLWRRRAIRAALGRYTGLLQTHRADDRVAGHARARLRVDPARRLDRLRGHGGRGPRRPGRHGARWTSAGPTSGRGRRCWRRSGRAARAPSSRPARPSTVERRRPRRAAASTGGSGSSRRRSAVA